MQGDIIDAILGSTGPDCRVVDPFVGSGTVMTEALLRGLDFTGVDINPLAVLVCEAKAAIDDGANVEGAAQTILLAIRADDAFSVDVAFPGLSKWFDEPAAVRLSRIRRAIMSVEDQPSRKVMWTAFAETIRVCSNSRTSTYKLHLRSPHDRVDADRITSVFEANLCQTLQRIGAYRTLIADRARRSPDIQLICDDVRRASVGRPGSVHQILVTSPPYGDNGTTIPYGQFSYLAIRWIPACDLHARAKPLTASTHSLDTASLGGSLKEARSKADKVKGISPSLDAFIEAADADGRGSRIRKVANFMADFLEALRHLRETSPGSAHWVLTTGNRTAAGLLVPFDAICNEMACYLGGKSVASLHRRVPGKRMPSRNNMGAMITSETTTVVEFA
ncbi:RsmD family RNA methyltransferase [Methylobacterium sp. E-066]|uniref:RsmD family RNA methyltransferase n=1 Tax=Methylobacterium sp. E-066 TaxID=2836584 RepID=UPI001FBAAFC8|nr:RsmD family RNA methyltransferase [Methylobacterium sp. E-066]MCJ2143209.1 RsmD family RNA methyltransferase [Methylobacterium sp. E-066]